MKIKSILFVVISILFAGCPGPIIGKRSHEKISCPDNTTRLTVDCTSVSSLKERVASVNIGIPSIGLGIGGSYEERALGDITDTTQHLAVSLEAKCQQYNACVISAEDWTKSEHDIRDQLIRHVNLASNLKSSDSQQSVANELWSNAVPEKAAKQLSLDYALEVKQGDEFRTHSSGSNISSGDEFRLRVFTNQPAYVYILLFSSQGESSQLFPMEEINLRNPVQPFVNTLIPDEATGTFQLDNITGEEHIQIVASTEPVMDVENRLNELASSETPSPNQGQKMLSTIGSLLCSGNEAAKTRGVNLKPSAVDCGGIKTRGINLKKAVPNKVDNFTGGSSTVVATPNDNVIVLQHTIKHK